MNRYDRGCQCRPGSLCCHVTVMVFQIIFGTQIFIHHDDVAKSLEAPHVESPPLMGTFAKIKLTVSKLTWLSPSASSTHLGLSLPMAIFQKSSFDKLPFFPSPSPSNAERTNNQKTTIELWRDTLWCPPDSGFD